MGKVRYVTFLEDSYNEIGSIHEVGGYPVIILARTIEKRLGGYFHKYVVKFLEKPVDRKNRSR